jgi:WD40 repeat protein
MVTGSYDGMLRLWDLNTGVVLKKMEGHRSRVRALAISPNEEWIVSGDEDGELIAWHGETGEQLNQPINKAHNGCIFSLDFSPDSSTLASGSSDTTTMLWSTSTWELRYSLNCGGNIRCVRFSAGGLLAIATVHGTQIYRNYISNYDYYNYGSRSTSFPTQLMQTVGGGSDYSLAWTPDGTRLLSGGNGTNPNIREWEHGSEGIWIQVGDPWKGHFKEIHAISLNSSGTLLASASHDNRVRLWRLSDRKNIATFKHSGAVNCVTFSADGKHVLSGGVDQKISDWPTSEDTFPEDGSKDGLMKEQTMHQVGLFVTS